MPVAVMRSGGRYRVGSPDEAAGVKLVGCCGAHCGTCRSLALGTCVGCRTGYDEGERDIARVKCRIKACCLGARALETCADCPEFCSCDLLAQFHGKAGREYGMYRESLEFIRTNGYPEFLRRARGWRRAYGRL